MDVKPISLGTIWSMIALDTSKIVEELETLDVVDDDIDCPILLKK